MKRLSSFLITAVLCGAQIGFAVIAVPASAQQETPMSGMQSPMPMHGMQDATHIAGTITAVSGHLVTLQQARGSVVINDQPALNKKTTGDVAVGRQIIAIGYWRGGTFYANALNYGVATPTMMADAGRVSGTITIVSGHLVTLQRTRGTLVINDQSALDHKATGNVAVGRQVVAHGYWRAGTFYATTIDSLP